MALSDGRLGEIDKLKSLLFSPEAARLDAAEAQIEGLENRVGDARRLEAATAEILVEAFRRAEVARHRELAAAVAPVIVAAIRNEIHNSRDMMVEALYPITGRLVSAAVANAFRELIESINQRVDQLLSTRQWRMRLRSWFSGRPMAEIALAEARAPVFRRIFLFERGSGRLIANWRFDREREDNPELMSGMIAAISEFASNVLSGQQGELRTLDLGGSKVFLRASARTILAAELTGELRVKAQQRLDQAFLDLVDRQERGAVIDNAALGALAEGLPREDALIPGRSRRLRLAVAGAIVLLVIGFSLSGSIQRWRKGAMIADAFHEAVASVPDLAPYPLRVDIDHAGGRVTLRGLAGSRAQTDAVVAKLRPAAAPYDVTADVAILAPSAALQSAAAAVDARVAALDEKLAALAESAQATAHEASVSETERLDALRREIAARSNAENTTASAAAARMTALESDLAATSRQLRSESADNVARLTQDIEGIKRDFAASTAALKAESVEGVQSVSVKLAALDASLAVASRRIDAALGDLSSPHRRLLETIAQSAVFFGDEDNFVDPAAVAKTLDALAPVIVASKEGVRVVGHADVTGGPWINERLSRRRAEKIAQMLRERGVPADELVVVARSSQESIAVVAAGVAQVNRRVTFEPLLSGERGADAKR
jgi:outer membrane protein OmpA-like peptidoglycan-associated protein